jgi:hypothetical protein
MQSLRNLLGHRGRRLAALVMSTFLATGAVWSASSPASATTRRSRHPHVKVKVTGNWAGYWAVDNTSVPWQGVQATFQVPKLNCSRKTSKVGIWVGVGGEDKQHSLAQLGVTGYCDKGKGAYLGWSEWYDSKKKNSGINFTKITIKAGDFVNPELVYNRPNNPNVWLADLWVSSPDGQTAVESRKLTDKGGHPIGNIAECIVERIGQTSTFSYPLAAFHPVTIDQCTAGTSAWNAFVPTGKRSNALTGKSESSLPVQKLQLDNGKKVSATAGRPTTDGTFTVTFHRT